MNTVQGVFGLKILKSQLSMSKPTYGAQLQQRLDYLNLTIYGAAQIIGAETDEPIKTIHQRITRYLEADPESLIKWSEVIEALGGEIEIKWKK